MSLTSEKRVRKREQSKSLLNELDGELLLPPDENVGLSASAIADIVHREIRMGFSPLEARLTSMETVLGNRVDNIDQQLKNHGDRIEKMEALLGPKDATRRSRTSEHSLSVEKQITDLQMQLDGLCISPKTDKPEPAKVMFVGGLAAFLDMQSATTWVTNTLESMRGPSIISTYIKSEKFQGLLFVKFASVVDCDTAATLLRSGSLKIGDSPVWATQDLPVPVRSNTVTEDGILLILSGVAAAVTGKKSASCGKAPVVSMALLRDQDIEVDEVVEASSRGSRKIMAMPAHTSDANHMPASSPLPVEGIDGLLARVSIESTFRIYCLAV
ncbi:hypothetical protein AK812_SmicGene29943 [Symbiodinium microadriaticum]|uniref:Uncharacterized protein n=1 Tax=Symbiodinium microadriaticum TaxID=2951 RepID=A0A1Q9D0H2_SYMMI|nr:hypothetical protein AK812_SmicGene29943 [Symbiodinium microadriaticum]